MQGRGWAGPWGLGAVEELEAGARGGAKAKSRSKGLRRGSWAAWNIRSRPKSRGEGGWGQRQNPENISGNQRLRPGPRKCRKAENPASCVGAGLEEGPRERKEYQGAGPKTQGSRGSEGFRGRRAQIVRPFATPWTVLWRGSPGSRDRTRLSCVSCIGRRILNLCATWGSVGKESARNAGEPGWLGKIPWRRKWQPTPGLLPGEFRGQRSWASYSPGDRKDKKCATHSLFTWGAIQGP